MEIKEKKKHCAQLAFHLAPQMSLPFQGGKTCACDNHLANVKMRLMFNDTCLGLSHKALKN